MDQALALAAVGANIGVVIWPIVWVALIVLTLWVFKKAVDRLAQKR